MTIGRLSLRINTSLYDIFRPSRRGLFRWSDWLLYLPPSFCLGSGLSRLWIVGPIVITLKDRSA